MAFQSNFPNNISGDNGFSIGDIKWSSADLTQAGFLVANGAEVGRATYPDLCAVYESMGFPWGAGDGSTTFNLPNLIGKFPEGADSAGGYHEAGLPNIKGEITNNSAYGIFDNREIYGYITSGAFYKTQTSKSRSYAGMDNPACNFSMDASKSNPIYGNSTTVQPPSALLIPYVKAFAGASADSTDLAISEVANDVANIDVRKLNKSAVKSYVVESVVNDDGSWYRKYSDGWLEQGGLLDYTRNYAQVIITTVKPFANTNYYLSVMQGKSSSGSYAIDLVAKTNTNFTIHNLLALNTGAKPTWYACGMGAK